MQENAANALNGMVAASQNELIAPVIRGIVFEIIRD